MLLLSILKINITFLQECTRCEMNQFMMLIVSAVLEVKAINAFLMCIDIIVYMDFTRQTL